MSTEAILPQEAQQILKSFEVANDYQLAPNFTRLALNVLIIDDDSIDFEILSRSLSKLRRYDVTAFHAENVSHAVSLAEAHTIDIAFVDYNLGVDCGLRAIKHIGGRCGDCPVILISGLAGHHIQELAISAGAINHLDKSHLSPSILETTIQSTLYTFQIEKQLQKTVTKLNEANKAKENFFAHMSHDLKTPLNAILGYSEALKMGTFGSLSSRRAMDSVDTINQAGNRLLETINSLICRISNGEYMDETTFEYADVVKIISTAIETVTPFAHSQGQKLSFLSAKRNMFIDCNVEQLTLAVTNLLTNAIKYSPKASDVKVHITADSKNLNIIVEDQGIGMNSEQIALAVKNKGRVDLPADIAREGTGIGLTIVRSAVKCHHGKLTIESIPGKGSKFKMIIPQNQ